MRAAFYLGWILIIAALISAVAEQTVRLYPGGMTIITPAYDLWYTIWPGSLTVIQIRIERIAPFLWDPLLTFILAFPAWFLLGLPGVTLAWRNRSGRIMSAREEEEHRKHVEALLLYDELTKDAKLRKHAAELGDTTPAHDNYAALEFVDHGRALTDEELIPTDEEVIEAMIEARKNSSEPPNLN